MNTLSTLKSTTLAIALAFGATSVQAATLDSNAVADSVENGRFSLETEFKKLDTDSNGFLSQTEFSKDEFFTKGHFTKADIDKDGALNQEEYVNYKSGAQKQAVKRVTSDSVITSKAKANLLAERNFKSTQISVKTFNGVVILSGFVDDDLAKAKAEAIVSKIEGVKSITNSLVVKG
ncbi:MULTISPECIES: BON domain-containing protein [Methylotenera]|uniref:BON domain-containing protein n=1 Tax=Methylotenera TaxID=359407 RepID=UPI00037EDCFD|nr:MULTISPECIES: BON domain-containing protein [Methylotenera]